MLQSLCEGIIRCAQSHNDMESKEDGKFSLNDADFERNGFKKYQLNNGAEIKSFAPKVFHNIRELYNIKAEDYIKSWTLPKESTIGKEGAGKSGSLFLKSNCKQFFLKTLPHIEVESILKILNSYYSVVSSRKTYIMRNLGVFRVKMNGKVNYCIIFCNVLYNNFTPVDTIYDLKGVRVPEKLRNRKLQNQEEKDSSYVNKEVDLNRTFIVQVLSTDEESFFNTIIKDIAFFRENNLMDYSFLIGIAKHDWDTEPETLPSWSTSVLSEDGTEVYHVGFIDCLTKYTFRKKVAHVMKTIVWPSDTLSTINPKDYSKRIQTYLLETFQKGSKDEAPA